VAPARTEVRSDDGVHVGAVPIAGDGVWRAVGVGAQRGGVVGDGVTHEKPANACRRPFRPQWQFRKQKPTYITVMARKG
jgi:hypothetical protein